MPVRRTVDGGRWTMDGGRWTLGRTVIVLCLAAIVTAWSAAPARLLDIYWIDTEGGASTFIVTASGRSVLVDTGYAGLGERDPSRIEQVVRREAGISRIDYVVTSHFHADHVGGLQSVAKRIPVITFIDHGESVDRGTAAGQALWDQYLAVVGTNRRVVKPGERLDLPGVEFTFVTAHGQVVTSPVGRSEPNPLCSTFKAQAEDAGENGKSIGYLLRTGSFEFLDLGDLSWNFQQQLVCPANLLGSVDLAQAPHHAVRDDVLPQMLWAVRPTVVVMNNGPAKGAGAVAVEAVLKSPGLVDAWSLHRAVANDNAHNAPEALTANLGAAEGCAGAWIRARLEDNGTFTITNSRNTLSKTYRVK